MTGLIQIDSERFESMEEVAKLRMQGKTDTYIAKQLGLRRMVVQELYNEWTTLLVKDSDARDRAKESLNVMVVHFDKLIDESYGILGDLKGENFSHQVAAQMNATLRNIAHYEAERLDAWQKAGLLDGEELGNELIEMEEKQQMLINILRNDLCADCRMTVANKLKYATNVVEATVVYED